MSTEYQLSYTAAEIDERLGKIDTLSDYGDRILALEQGNTTALRSRTYTNYVDGEIGAGYTSTGSIDFLVYEIPENAVIVDISLVYEGKEQGTYDLIANGVINGNSCVKFYPVVDNEFGIVASIINPQGTTTDLANRIVSGEEPITAFTLYYLDTSAESNTSGDVNVDLTGYAKTEDIPTKTSQLENDSKFITAANVSTEIETALAEAKASGEFDGADGQDGKNGIDGKDGNGISSVVLNDDYTLTLNFTDGTSYTTTSIRGADGIDGKNGTDGTDGNDGVSVSSIEQTTTSTADGGTNVITVTLSNGQTFTFNVKNGSKGSTGTAGTNGKDGNDGADGYTPVKGTDYFTEADKAEIVDDVVTETGIEIIPDYVITEAESVIDRIIAAQGNRTFTFAAISDLHYGNASYTDGVRHACQAMKYIDERIKLDAVAVLGDYTDGYPIEGFENAIGDFKTINSVLADLRFAPNLRMQGNHDYYADHTALVNRFIQSYSDNVVWGDKAGGYFYKDFDEFKLRVICVNTTETGNSNIGCSTAQFEWFVNSLDLTAKENASEWQILILSHHPLDWYCIDSTYRFCYILEGYKNGSKGTAGGIAYDFTDKNSATLIGNIHGHIHNLLTDRINKGNINTLNPTTVMRMCTPEACINRANQYDGWKEDTTYNKTINTAQDTSFIVYCINLDDNTISAICYGAGYDRKINYLGAALTYTITNNLTNVTTDNTATIVDENTSYTANLTATEGDIVSVVVTMGGEDITSTAYANGVISIAAVTGDVVITAGAKEQEPETTYTNQIPISIGTDGNVYNNGIGYKDGYRLNSSGAETAATGSSVTGFIPVTQESIIRLKNIALTVGVDSTNQYIRIYDSSFAHIGGFKTNQWGTWLCADVTTDSTTGYVTSFRLTNGLGDKPAYLRISANTFDSTAVITVNEPIE